MHSTQGIVLKKIDAGEADALFIIYTKDFGKICARAQGVKKEAAKLKGHLEPLCLSSVQFVLGKGGERLTHAELLEYWPALRQNEILLAHAYYVARLFDAHCHPGEKDENLWNLFLNTIALLEQGEEKGPEKLAEDFERRFLNLLGYGGEKDMQILGAAIARPFI